MGKGNGLLIAGAVLLIIGFFLILASVFSFYGGAMMGGSVGMIITFPLLFIGAVLIIAGIAKKVYSNIDKLGEGLAKKTAKSTEMRYESLGKGLGKGLKK